MFPDFDQQQRHSAEFLPWNFGSCSVQFSSAQNKVQASELESEVSGRSLKIMQNRCCLSGHTQYGALTPDILKQWHQKLVAFSENTHLGQMIWHFFSCFTALSKTLSALAFSQAESQPVLTPDPTVPEYTLKMILRTRLPWLRAYCTLGACLAALGPWQGLAAQRFPESGSNSTGTWPRGIYQLKMHIRHFLNYPPKRHSE